MRDAITSAGDTVKRHWRKTVGTVLGVLLAVAAALFTLMQVEGWSF
jgi:uncharacterized membrane protein YccC